MDQDAKGPEPLRPGQRIVYVSGDALCRLLRHGMYHARTRVVLGLPDDVEYVRCFDNPEATREFCLVFRSRRWASGPAGARIPRLDLHFETTGDY